MQVSWVILFQSCTISHGFTECKALEFIEMETEPYLLLQVKLLYLKLLKEVTYIIQQEKKPLVSYPNFIKQIEWNSFPFTIKAMLYSEKRFIEHAKNLKVVLFQEEIQFHSIYTLCTYFTGNTTLLTFFLPYPHIRSSANMWLSASKLFSTEVLLK